MPVPHFLLQRQSIKNGAYLTAEKVEKLQHNVLLLRCDCLDDSSCLTVIKYLQIMCFLYIELNDFIIQLDEEVEGMQSTILVLQQQLKETRQQLAQYQQQQSQASNPGTSRTPSSEPTDQGEAVGKDCSRLANGPSNGSSSHQRTSGPGFYREGSSTEDDFPASPGNGNKLSNHSEDRTGRGGGSYINQLSTGYESVDSPTGSENSLTHHSNDTDSNHDPQEEKTVSMKGNRTVGSRHVQNGLDSSVNVQGSVL